MTLKQFARLTSVVAAMGLATFSYADEGTVNINKADAIELAAAIDGVGLRRAEAIVAYRNEYGPFEDVYELINVSGVGERTVVLNEDRLRLK